MKKHWEPEWPAIITIAFLLVLFGTGLGYLGRPIITPEYTQHELNEATEDAAHMAEKSGFYEGFWVGCNEGLIELASRAGVEPDMELILDFCNSGVMWAVENDVYEAHTAQ